MKKGNLSRMLISIIVVLLCLSLLTALDVQGQEDETDTEQVLVFLEDVIQLDMTKYKVDLSILSVRDWQTSGQYRLRDKGTGGEYIIEANFNLRNNILTWCKIKQVKGTPYYSNQPTQDLKSNVAEFLDRYQNYTSNSNIQDMKNMLDIIDVTKNMALSTENLKLEVRIDEDRTDFQWRHLYNGAIYTGLNVGFQNNSFLVFSDDQTIYSIGDTTVNISADRALSIALGYFETSSVSYDGKLLDRSNILMDHSGSNLRTRSRYDYFVLYPYWMVDLQLDEVYGFTYFYEVLIWADNGEVFDFYPLGYGGLMEDGDSVNPSNTPTPTPTNQLIEEYRGFYIELVDDKFIVSENYLETYISPLFSTIEEAKDWIDEGPTATPTPEPQQTEFPTTIAVVSVAVIAVVGLGILAYFNKTKRSKGK